MKLISTLYSTMSLDVSLIVQNRSTKTPSTEAVPNGPLITRHMSKIGTASLIFNPSVAIVIRPRGTNTMNSAWITSTMFYRFVTALTTVYQGLSDDKLFHTENSVLYLDKKKAADISRRVSLYRNALTIMPCVMSLSESYIRGINLMVDTDQLGSMTHLEALGFLELLERFDMTTFTLLAGVVDELEMMSDRLTTMDMKLNEILELCRAMQHASLQQKPSKQEESWLHWESVPDRIR